MDSLMEYGSLLVIIIVLFIFIILLTVFIVKYKTAGPDEALIITGSYLGGKNVHVDSSGNKIKIIRGGGAFVLPVFQQAKPLSLLSIKLDVSTPEVYTEQGVPVMADGTSIIKIGSSVEEIMTAAEQFLGKAKSELEHEAKEVLEGHLRSILGTMTVEEIYKNRDKFSQEVQRVASQDLAKMGLVIVSFTIKDVRDEKGYLESLGKPRIAQVKRDADIATAIAEKETRIERAKATKEAKREELERATEIAEAEKINQLKMAEYRQEQEIAKARADQAYTLEKAKASQEVKEQEMQIEIIERQKQIELEEKEILRREKQYDSEVKKKADAERYAAEQAVLAEKAKKKADAEARQYQITTLAEAESQQLRAQGSAKAESELAQGKADAEVIRLRGLAEAEAKAEQLKAQGNAKAEAELAQGKAEAEVVRLRGLAEAEAKQKIAEAFEMYGQAAIMDMMIKMLPEYAKAIASPLSNIDKITVVDTGGSKNGGANKITGYATDLLASTQESLKETVGIDLKEMLENYAGKHNLKPSIEKLTNAVKEQQESNDQD